MRLQECVDALLDGKAQELLVPNVFPRACIYCSRGIDGNSYILILLEQERSTKRYYFHEKCLDELKALNESQ